MYAMSEQPRTTAALFACALLCCLAVSADAAELVIVRAAEADPYVRAEKALSTELENRSHHVRVLTLKEVAEQGIESSLGRPAAVVAVGTPAAAWLHKQLPADVPLVYCMVTNAEGAGLTEGRQATGVTTDVPLPAQLQLIGESLPRARAVGMLYRSDTADGKRQLKQAQAALPAGWKLQAVAVNEQSSVAAAIDALLKKSPDVVWTCPDQAVFDAACIRTLLLAALRNKVPVWGFSPAFVRAGALLGVGVDPGSQGTQAAEVVLQILAQPKAAEDRALAPRQFQIAVNLIVAEQLDVAIPESVTKKSTYVFKADKQ